MKITDVIRGDDHLNNTPRQVNIMNALNMPLPNYAHVPMILGGDGKRLSKRHGAVSVLQYRQAGILPEALLNYLARLGWGHGDQEVFSLAEMIELFSLDAVNKAAASFDENKLLWLNQHYLKSLPVDAFITALAKAFEERGIEVADGPPLTAIIAMQKERVKTLVEMVEKSKYFYQDIDVYDDKAARKNFKVESVNILATLKQGMADLVDWNPESIHQVIINVAAELDLKLGKVAQPLRVAVTGGSVSPPIDETCYHLGKERVLERLDQAIRYIEQIHS